MIRHLRGRVRGSLFGLMLLQLHFGVGAAFAGEPSRRVGRAVAVTRVWPCPAYRATSSLGTFYPTPYIMVRGNLPIGGGYSPLGIYGDQTLALSISCAFTATFTNRSGPYLRSRLRRPDSSYRGVLVLESESSHPLAGQIPHCR